MAGDIDYRLTGGMFFMLLLTARKHRIQKKYNWLRETDDLNDWQVMFGIDRIISPNCPEVSDSMMSTYEPAVSRYKSCGQNKSTYLMMTEPSVKGGFDNRVKNDYDSVCSEMSDFADTFLLVNTKEEKDVYLVKALLDLIDKDSTTENAVFYAGRNGEIIKRDALLTADEICFESFLLGVLHYIVMHVPKNKDGEDTYNACCPPGCGGERPYDYRFGQGTDFKFELTYYCQSKKMPKIHVDTPKAEAEPEVVQAEPVPETIPTEDVKPQTVNQRIINMGDGSKYFEHIENYFEGDDD